MPSWLGAGTTSACLWSKLGTIDESTTDDLTYYKLTVMKLTLFPIIAVLATTFAFAQDSEKRPAPPEGGPRGERGGGPDRMMQMLPIFKALDKDGDGELSSSEIEGAIAALKTCDKNGDGKLTGEEIMGKRGRRPGGPGGVVRGQRPQRPDSDS